MMNKSKTKKAGLIKYSLILPAAILLILASNAEMLLASAMAETRVNNPAVVMETPTVTDRLPTEAEWEEAARMFAQQAPPPPPPPPRQTPPPPPPPPPPVANPAVPAQFPGGERALQRFLADNIRYPVIAVENNIQGRVVVDFLIGANGRISNIRVIQSVDPLLDREAIRVVEQMPNWIPGEHPRGHRALTVMTLPINFRLNGAPQMHTAPADANEVVVVGLSAPPPPTARQRDGIFEVVDVMPQFPGGQRAMMQFLSDNIRYPAEAMENGIQGRVIVQFIVNTDGSIQDINVVRGVDPLLDAEAVRIVEQMPRWIPGEHPRGTKVNTRFALPITFRLD